MGISDVANSAKGMFTDGAMTEKAAIFVLNPACQNLKLDDIADAANSLLDSLKSGSLLEDTKEKLTSDKIKDVTGYGSKNNKKGIGEVAKEDSQKRWIKVKVQYNPATIRMYSAIGRLQDFDKKENGISKLNIINLSGKTKLSFDLIFDDVDNIDAFMLENLTPNVGNVASKAGDMVTHAGGNGHSVRKQMDAFMSLLSVFETQQVVFCWANMSFRGTLTTVNNHFTMFNTKGNPVRGVMHLEITQETNEKNVLKYDSKVWDDAFYKKFTEATVGGLSTFDQLKNNNILNI